MKVLFILHTSPPKHGAAKVGDFIKESEKINNEFQTKFIPIKSSETIADIGKFNLKKIKYILGLYFKVLHTLVFFRPDKIYYTASIRSVALYRDILISTLWKVYSKFKNVEIYYHYHTKGVDEYVSKSKLNLLLTKFFIENVNLILLSPLLKKDFDKVKVYKRVFFLPNGVEDNMQNENFEEYIENKYTNIKSIQVLYISNMIKSKGYFEVLKLSKKYPHIQFNFAGGWQKEEDKKEFFKFVQENNLKNVIFHGFISGVQKHKLWKESFLFIFPTRYPNEAFPLSLLESLSYGVPAVTTNEGSIPYIIDKNSGVVIDNLNKLEEAFDFALKSFINKKSALYCRERYLNNFTLEKFETNLINILKEKDV